MVKPDGSETYDAFAERVKRNAEITDADATLRRLVGGNRLKMVIKATPRVEGQPKVKPVLVILGVK
jgi:hypothetical protein